MYANNSKRSTNRFKKRRSEQIQLALIGVLIVAVILVERSIIAAPKSSTQSPWLTTGTRMENIDDTAADKRMREAGVAEGIAVQSLNSNMVNSAGLAKAQVVIPAVMLVSSEGKAVDLPSVIGGNRSVVLQFVFTSCQNVCPIMVTTFSESQQFLARHKAQLVSISIDPAFDTPAKLQQYANRFGAHVGTESDWIFLTGALGDIDQVKHAFDAIYSGANKAHHKPVIYLKPEASEQWYVLDALSGVETFQEQVAVLLGSH
ncbi:SCO1 protein [BD1-7 clade bacterium]|uniref:SCO1 protein n=1 Tax=BD1-7 clade bacterium TaxID=2029982 RepID=A0A5S9QDG6_9GAMM|nr:SCO1 protein [BD1-7 clade bacterium]CAA0115842.1 SCO1 protein [BD1-7 clade bacterium]CAA0119520.1 SCO1 protein [BD1-7 clade bacterium]